MAQMPFADSRGPVSSPLEDLGKGHFAGIYPMTGLGPKGAMNPDAVGITTRKERGPRRRTDRLGHMKVRKSPPIFCQLVQMGCANIFGFKGTNIRVSKIVTKDQDNVRAIFLVICLLLMGNGW
jgi:hypothetical protein